MKKALLNAMKLAAAFLALTFMLCLNVWAQDAGKQAYDEKCVACHGANGKGDGPAGAALTPPPQDFAKSLKGKSDDWIAKVTKEGGPAVGLPATMPPFSDLSDDQVKGLVAYMKQLAGK
jgi:mono/diheme cytochrome c family protein